MGQILPLLIGGLILFLYAITRLSDVMTDVFTEKAKEAIAKSTRTLFLSILTGMVFTILLGSSSAVIILAIVFINAKALSFRQAIGIIMGANIGTTFSSQIIALDVGQYAVIPLALGLLVQAFTKNEKLDRYGEVLFFFGLLFFGLYMMEESVWPLKDSTIFTSWIKAVEGSPIQGTLIGGLITLIIQSSSATVGIAIILGKQDLLSLSGGVSIMLGAELGTCSDTLIATFRGSRQALKAGLFHLFFNLASIFLGLLAFGYLLDLIEMVSDGQGLDKKIANAHMLFNLCGVLLFLPFVGFAEKMLNRLLPDKEVA
ncbi:MAG: Na/Pi symporter [Bacteroidia bacterium]